VLKYILEARSLVKRVKGKSILDGIHLQIEEGDAVGFYTPDQESQDVLLDVLSTSEPQSAGDLYINGVNTKFDLKRVKKILSSVIYAFDPELSVRQNLQIHAKFFELNPLDREKKIVDTMRFLDIEDLLPANPKSLSAFDLFRLGIVRALITSPKILFVREPWFEMQREQKIFILEVLEEIKENTTLIFAAKSLEWLHHLANKVGVLNQGKIKDFGPPQILLKTQVGFEVIEFVYREDEIDYFIGRLNKEYDYHMLEDRLFLFLKPGQDSKKILEMINSDEVIIRKPDLNDLLIRHVAKLDSKDMSHV
jgi:ABC-type multidrug transport system ATPase subunit